MLQVRRVRVGDVTLQPIHYDIPETNDDEPDGVMLKAETRRGVGVRPDRARNTLDWASLHMNLSLQNAVAPGAELLMAVSDAPTPAESNMFSGELNRLDASALHGFLVSMKGYVNRPEDDDLFSFVITPEDGGDSYEVRFHGYEAHRFIQALLYEWCSGLQK